MTTEENKTLSFISADFTEDNLKEYVIEKLGTFKVKGKQKKMSDGQVKNFVAHCVVNQLNPLKGEVHAVPFWNAETDDYDIQPITHYSVYLKRAMESGQLRGYDIQQIDDAEGKFKGIRLVIHRKGFDMPFVNEVLYDQVAKRTKSGTITTVWKENAVFMTKKQAIRETFPMAFPEFMKGEFYMDQEQGDDDTNTPVNIDNDAITHAEEQRAEVEDEQGELYDYDNVGKKLNN